MTYYQQDNIGKAKYTISYQDSTKHKDGSPFFGIRLFKNKKSLNAFKKELNSKGYKQTN